MSIHRHSEKDHMRPYAPTQDPMADTCKSDHGMRPEKPSIAQPSRRDQTPGDEASERGQ
jgi:hypothetical protein